jgi:hypothetical protein
MKRLAVALLLTLAACSGGATGGGPPPIISTPTPAPSFGRPSLASVQRISSDPFTNGASQHKTQVESSAAAFGSTVVAAFQSGRFFTQGSSDIAVAASVDGGITWHSTALPGTTHYALPSGPYDSISDPSVAYDERHATWLVAALPVSFAGIAVPGVVVSRSPDGLTWSAPVGVTPANETDNDKSWIACDDHPSSAYYGHCYVEWDEFGGSGVVNVSVSVDGGQTWSTPTRPSTSSGGIGGQPLVRPNGTVVMPIDTGDFQRIVSYTSRDGGITWSPPVSVANVIDHAVAGGFRFSPFVSVAQDSAGTIYAVWQDCRFRTNCTSNDLVLATSADGTAWSSPSRIPIDAVSSGADHFVPGLSVDISTSGSGAHLGVLYYSYANANCSRSTCALSANFIGSHDGGATWGSPQLLAGPMSLGWLANTELGAMVGDYSSAAFVSGRPVPVAAIAEPLSGAAFDEAMYVPKAGAISLQSRVWRSSAKERPVAGPHSDHPPLHIIPRQ